MKKIKLTEKKLRQIIREEKAKLQEVRGLEGVAFYKERVRLLQHARDLLEEAVNALADVSDLDLDSPAGEDPDVQSAMMDVQTATEFVEGIIMATEAMVDMG